MRQLCLVIGFFLATQSKGQMTYYDAAKLRSATRWQYTWDITVVSTSASGASNSLTTTLSVQETDKYRADYLKPDSAVKNTDGSSKKIIFTGFKDEKIVFSNDDEIVPMVKSILTFYHKNATEANFLNVRQDYINNNKFIGQILERSDGYGAGGGNPISFLGKLVSGASNLDVTTFADGFAKFLVERTKEELNEAFFRKFADFINHYPEFRTLFPYTNTFINSFNSWEYSNLLNTLREAFDKDIKELLTNFIKLKELTSAECKELEDEKICDKSKKWCGECNERLLQIHEFFTETNEGLFLLSAARIGNGILQNEKLPDILNAVTQPDFLLGYKNSGNATLESDLKNSLQLTNIFSLSLKSEETGRNYIAEEQFKMLLNDPVLQNLYFGLVYQQIANANNGQGIKIGPITITNILKPDIIQGFRGYISNIGDQSKYLQKTYEKLLSDKLEGKADLGPDYALVFEGCQKLIGAASSLNIINAGLKFPKELDKAFSDASKGLQIAHDVAVRNYNAAVIGILKFISDAVKPYLETKPHLQEFVSAFLKYGSFASNVVLSKDPDDIKEAIKSFVLPSGSSSLKKHNYFTISLNSYVGFVYGSSKKDYTTKGVSGQDSTVKLNGGKSIGIYAPVGVGFNFGLGWKYKNPGSLSIFLSLIDIGAVVGYRFVTDTGEISQKFKINLSNIFAPGGNVIVGLPNMPLSIGTGVQWIPVLQRDPRSNSFYNIDHSGLRWQVFATVDLPLLNFHSSRHSLLYVKSHKNAGKKN
ncbi:MAG: hypothetical protein ABI675_19685 [Chitinophagaceae bacterium]